MGTFTAVPAAGAKLRGSVLSSLVTELRPLWAMVDSDHALAINDTVLEDITDLVVALAASTTYEFLCVINTRLSTGSTEDIKIGCSFPTGATVDFGGVGPHTSATSASGDGEFVRRSSATTASTTSPYGVNGTTDANILITFRVTTGANAGNLTIMAAQNTSGGNTVTVKAGSYLKGQQVL